MDLSALNALHKQRDTIEMWASYVGHSKSTGYGLLYFKQLNNQALCAAWKFFLHLFEQMKGRKQKKLVQALWVLICSLFTFVLWYRVMVTNSVMAEIRFAILHAGVFFFFLNQCQRWKVRGFRKYKSRPRICFNQPVENKESHSQNA